MQSSGSEREGCLGGRDAPKQNREHRLWGSRTSLELVRKSEVRNVNSGGDSSQAAIETGSVNTTIHRQHTQ